MMAVEHLKIKIKYLAEEARIIKAHERKRLSNARYCKSMAEQPTLKSEILSNRAEAFKGYAKNHYFRYRGLRTHRIEVVRKELRDSLIAYGYLRGRAYRQIEQSNKEGKPGPDWNNVIEIIGRFGGPSTLGKDDVERTNAILAWRDADKAKKAA